MAAKKQRPVRLPAPTPEISQWVILALDPSLTQTGYALMIVTREGEEVNARWHDVGSVAPGDSSLAQWIRATAISRAAKLRLGGVALDLPPQHTGFLLVVEHPTPREDRLVSLNRILHRELFVPGFEEDWGAVRVLSLNASTLRSLMGLKAKGSKNKAENKAKAYTFISEASFPNLDNDACDAVLLAKMGQHVTSLLFGLIDLVPPPIFLRLCDSTDKVKGKGRNQKIVTEGVLHQSQYWYSYRPTECVIELRDAKSKKGLVNRKTFTV